MNSKEENLVAQLQKAVIKFEEILEKEKTEIVRDSAIQRFEFTFELSWKALKAILAEKGTKDLYNPKDVLKAAYQNNYIDNDHLWLKALEKRNQTSHLYKESLAEEVYASLPEFLPLFKKLATNLS